MAGRIWGSGSRRRGMKVAAVDDVEREVAAGDAARRWRCPDPCGASWIWGSGSRRRGRKVAAVDDAAALELAVAAGGDCGWLAFASVTAVVDGGG
ncbi:hypothetical protein OsJ_16927 [Oryza sativa Japonica Group]|uniref:Uncharacterized protein n=2 Tax=Oryza sativa subsp. japonica TaxID=39947 RepID=B9FGJ4_ORYSJ|nr:hypothetical protein OsJ_16927 [Oryza sativa Japonica Group]